MQKEKQQLMARVVETALMLAIEKRDRNTKEHCERVKRLSTIIGISMNLEKTDAYVLQAAALLHDLGKINIPDSILFKPSKLDQSEWETMRTHAASGAEMVEVSKMEHAKSIAKIIRHHHERLDGSGYPDGLKGKNIPLLSRIISVADSYDAISMHRHYSGATPHARALEIMRSERGTKLDPEVLDVFEDIINSGFNVHT
jgi:putative nucleotidyltransferase with HDIG domain